MKDLVGMATGLVLLTSVFCVGRGFAMNWLEEAHCLAELELRKPFFLS
jgi:hypothetical protein